MRWNWKPNSVAFVDVEVQSASPLHSLHVYAQHPSTRIITCCVKHNGEMRKFGPADIPVCMRYLEQLVAEGVTLVGHNALYDATVLEAAGLQNAAWFDTLPCARAAGLPGKLDELGILFTGEGKDRVGKRLIELLCFLKPDQKPPAIGPAHQLLLRYNARDVELLEAVYEQVHKYVEPDVMDVDRTINLRGIPLDRERLAKLRVLYTSFQERNEKEFDAQFGGMNPRSSKQVLKWLRSIGFNVSGTSRFVVRDILSNPGSVYTGSEDMDAAVELLVEMQSLRREIVRVGSSKADRAWEALEPDDRIRESLVYHKAHTGRWASRGAQWHNMPTGLGIDVRNLELTEQGVERKAVELSEQLKRRVYANDVLAAALRSLVRADNLNVADYGAVEARCIAWMADEHRMLKLFSDPEASVYLDMGRQVFGREIRKKTDEYTLAKTLVLGCGYGMSYKKFEAGCKLRSIKIVGTTAEEAVRKYRKAYPAIPMLWKAFQDASMAAVSGIPSEAGKCKLYMEGRNLVMQLPSGRCIQYRNVRVERMVPMWCKLYGTPEVLVDTVVFDKPHGTGFLYGSRLAENASQAICRDLLAECMVDCERACMHPVLHVHDEEINEDPPELLEPFLETMSTPPVWAKGFPLLVEGCAGPIWSKVTSGYKEAVYLCGRKVK